MGWCCSGAAFWTPITHRQSVPEAHRAGAPRGTDLATTPPLASPPCGHHISPPDSHPLYLLASWSSGTAAHMGSNSFSLCERDGPGPWLRSTCHFPGGSGFPGDELGQTASSPLSQTIYLGWQGLPPSFPWQNRSQTQQKCHFPEKQPVYDHTTAWSRGRAGPASISHLLCSHSAFFLSCSSWPSILKVLSNPAGRVDTHRKGTLPEEPLH